MGKNYQEWSLEFRRDADRGDIRGVVFHIYGGTVEVMIADVRKLFGLGPEWRVVSAQRDEAK